MNVRLLELDAPANGQVDDYAGWERLLSGGTAEAARLDLRLMMRKITSANRVSCLTGLSGIGANPITLLCIGGLTFAVLVAVQFLLELTSKKGEANG